MTEWLGASGFSPEFARTRAQALRIRPRLSAPLHWHSRVEFILGYSQTYSPLNTSRSTSEHLFAPSLLPHTQFPAHSQNTHSLHISIPYYYTTTSSPLSTPLPRNILAFFRMERGLWGMSTRLSPKILGRLDLKSTPDPVRLCRFVVIIIYYVHKQHARLGQSGRACGGGSPARFAPQLYKISELYKILEHAQWWMRFI